MLEICIVGLGALGTIYGYELGRSGKVKITAVCRSNYDILKDRGVDIHSEKFGVVSAWKPWRVLKTVEEAADRHYDYVVCTAKFLPDVIPTSLLLGTLSKRTSAIVLIQNGIGVEEDLMRSSTTATVISGCAWIDATVIERGTMVTHGKLDRLILGIHYPPGIAAEAKKVSKEHLDLFVEIICTGGGGGIATEDIVAQRWRKNLWNIGYSVICTLGRVNVATVLSDRWCSTTVPLVRGFMEEELAIARALRILETDLPDSAIVETTEETHEIYAETYPSRAQVQFVPSNFKPSMLVDLEAGRPMEVEGIIGAVVRQGKKLGVPIPRLETAYGSLALIQESILNGLWGNMNDKAVV